jgi:carbonic anhydrase
VSPEVIVDARPGELFVVRNVANLVPPYEPDGSYHGVSVALEFAVGALKVKHIVALGHGRCGGVSAFAEGSAPLSPSDFIGKWISLIAPAVRKLGPRDNAPDYLTRLEQASIANTLDNLMTFPRLRKLIERGRVTLHGAYFGVATGELSTLDRQSGRFVPSAAPSDTIDLRGIRTSSTLSDLPARQEPRQILALLKALKGQGWRSPKKLFQFLNNIGARAQRMHLGRVLEMAESSRNRYVSENKILERFGGQQELELVVPTPPATKSDLPPPDEPPLR